MADLFASVNDVGPTFTKAVPYQAAATLPFVSNTPNTWYVESPPPRRARWPVTALGQVNEFPPLVSGAGAWDPALNTWCVEAPLPARRKLRPLSALLAPPANDEDEVEDSVALDRWYVDTPSPRRKARSRPFSDGLLSVGTQPAAADDFGWRRQPVKGRKASLAKTGSGTQVNANDDGVDWEKLTAKRKTENAERRAKEDAQSRERRQAARIAAGIEPSPELQKEQLEACEAALVEYQSEERIAIIATLKILAMSGELSDDTQELLDRVLPELLAA